MLVQIGRPLFYTLHTMARESLRRSSPWTFKNIHSVASFKLMLRTRLGTITFCI